MTSQPRTSRDGTPGITPADLISRPAMNPHRPSHSTSSRHDRMCAVGLLVQVLDFAEDPHDPNELGSAIRAGVTSVRGVAQAGDYTCPLNGQPKRTGGETAIGPLLHYARERVQSGSRSWRWQ
jgi:hypothetical protein